jgi:hypothetical protein
MGRNTAPAENLRFSYAAYEKLIESLEEMSLFLGDPPSSSVYVRRSKRAMAIR